MKHMKLVALLLSFLICIETPLVAFASNYTTTNDILKEEISQTPDNKVTESNTASPASSVSDTSSNQNTKALSIFYVKQKITNNSLNAASINLDNKNSLTQKISNKLYTGQAILLTAAYTAQNSNLESVQEEIKWTTSNGSIKFKNQSAIIIPSKSGTLTVTASTKTQTANFKLQISGPVLTLNHSSTNLHMGEKAKLQATALPTSTITWTTSNSKIASISTTGEITAVKPGTATITATANNISTKCTVNVTKPTLTLEKKTLTVYMKNPVTLKATALPSSKITWSSSNKKIATVSSKGKITGKKTGTVTITATANGIKKTCKVKIKNPSLTISSTNINVIAGYSYQLSSKTRPAKKVKWSSSNKKIATVSSDGIVTGKKAGTVTITASFSGIKKTCEVTVEKNIFVLNKTSKTLLVGNNLTLNMPDNSMDVTYEITQASNDEVITLNTDDRNCTVSALKAGTATITATTYPTRNGVEVTCTSTCTIQVINSGVSPQQSSCAVGLTKEFSLINGSKQGTSIQNIKWASSKTDIAVIDSSTGVATAKKKGTTTITATVTYSNQTTQSFQSTLKVSSPSFSASKATLALNCDYKLTLSGSNNYSDIVWISSNPSVATASTDGTITAYRTGTCTISATIDDKKLDFVLTVSNPYLRTSYKSLSKGKTTTIKVSGKKNTSKVKFTSENTSVATVSKAGVVKAKNCGNTNIIITVDGKELIYSVSVATQTALNATKTARSIINSSTYSQSYRMTQGFYDCSSLVFRAYKKSTSLLGGSSSWAPTAAMEASYLESRGKVISYQWVDKSQLLPGDLIFYGNSPNGRYKGISHVSMYYGNGLCVEKPLRDYTYNANNVVMIARPTK